MDGGTVCQHAAELIVGPIVVARIIETEKFDAYPVALTTLTLRKSLAAAAEAMDNPTRLKIRPPTFFRSPGDVAPVLFQLFRQNSADNLCH